MLHVAVLEARLARITLHLLRKAQIAGLKQDEALTKVVSKYANYANVFFLNLAIELLKNTGMNKYTIKLEEGKQPPYKPIYSLGPVKLKSLKTFIEIHLKTRFFRLSKYLASAPILFDKKPDNSF